MLNSQKQAAATIEDKDKSVSGDSATSSDDDSEDLSKRRKGGKLGDMLFSDKADGKGVTVEDSLKEMLSEAKSKAAKLTIVE